MKAASASRGNTSTGPSGFRELRTAIRPADGVANSTQLPFGLLALLFRQRSTRRSRSTGTLSAGVALSLTWEPTRTR